MKRKILAIVSSVAMMLSLTACAEKADDSIKFTHGTLSGSGYSSELFGIKAEFDDSWMVYTDDDMASTNNISDMSEENVTKVLNDNAVLYEMMAGIDSGSNVNIVVENLKVTNGGKAITAEKYIENSLDGLVEGLNASYESATANIDKATLAGKEFPCIKAEITGNGLTATEILIPIIKGNYAAIITFTSLSEEDQQTLMNAFKSAG